MSRPLDGMLVLDLGQIYNGPYCGLLLGFMGARVLKIESPEGDIVRRRKRQVEPYPLVMLNSNKESVILDLKHADGKALFLRLARKADVVVENFAVGVMNRLGLGWDVLQKENPRLVYGSGTGFGLSGPYRDLPAMDLTIQAMSGIMNATGFPDRPPVKAGPAVCDFLGGAHLFAGILGALVQRERTGRGQFVEVAMLDAAIIALASALGVFMDGDTSVPAPATATRRSRWRPTTSTRRATGTSRSSRRPIATGRASPKCSGARTFSRTPTTRRRRDARPASSRSTPWSRRGRASARRTR